jgi:hypothetical protein
MEDGAPARKICRKNEKNVFTGDSTCGRIIPTAHYSTLTADVTFYIKCYIGFFRLPCNAICSLKFDLNPRPQPHCTSKCLWLQGLFGSYNILYKMLYALAALNSENWLFVEKSG